MRLVNAVFSLMIHIHYKTRVINTASMSDTNSMEIGTASNVYLEG